MRRTKDGKIKDFMLSSPLFFDIDMQLLSPPNLNSALQMSESLINYIKEKTGRVPDWIVFSGRRGFHIYYWKWDDIALKYCLADDELLFSKEQGKKW